jgi:hypothetical protein
MPAFRLTSRIAVPLSLVFVGAARAEPPPDAPAPRADAGPRYIASDRGSVANVADLRDPLATLLAIRGVTFDWDASRGGGHDIGFIAEEVGAVVPEAVALVAGHAGAVDPGRLTPLLVEGVKALLDRAESGERTLRSVVATTARLSTSLNRLDAASRQREAESKQQADTLGDLADAVRRLGDELRATQSRLAVTERDLEKARADLARVKGVDDDIDLEDELDDLDDRLDRIERILMRHLREVDKGDPG